MAQKIVIEKKSKNHLIFFVPKNFDKIRFYHFKLFYYEKIEEFRNNKKQTFLTLSDYGFVKLPLYHKKINTNKGNLRSEHKADVSCRRGQFFGLNF